MSLIFLGLLFLIALLICDRVQEYDSNGTVIDNLFFYIYLTYVFFLIGALFGSIGIGIFYWLKEGNWMDVTLNSLLSLLDEGNLLKEILLFESSWVGIQSISEWYLEQNIAWSTLIAMISVYIIGFVRSSELSSVDPK